MTSHPEKQMQYPIGQYAILILTNTLKIKGNEPIKFGQLTEYNTRNIFLEKSYTKCGGKTISTPFSIKSKLNVYLDQWPKAL